MSEVMCSGCNKTFDRAKARVFVKHRQNCHEDHGKHFDGASRLHIVRGQKQKPIQNLW